MIFSSLKIMIIFHNTSADFVLMSADVYFLAFEGHLSQKNEQRNEQRNFLFVSAKSDNFAIIILILS